MNERLLEALEKAREEEINDPDLHIARYTIQELVYEPLLDWYRFREIKKHPTKTKDHIKFFARGEHQGGHGWVDASVDLKRSGETLHRTFDIRFYEVDYSTIPATIKCLEKRTIKDHVTKNPSPQALAA